MCALYALRGTLKSKPAAITDNFPLLLSKAGVN
jgi:hypothetical protein